MAESEFYANGYADYYARVDDNPYSTLTAAFGDWERGWQDAHDEDNAPYDDNYIGDDYYSGTGELIGDDSYIDYLNNY